MNYSKKPFKDILEMLMEVQKYISIDKVVKLWKNLSKRGNSTRISLL